MTSYPNARVDSRIGQVNLSTQRNCTINVILKVHVLLGDEINEIDVLRAIPSLFQLILYIGHLGNENRKLTRGRLARLLYRRHG